jgi:hypothetical protein
MQSIKIDPFLLSEIFTESEFSSLKVRFSESFGAGKSSQFWTGLIVDGKSGYSTVYLDLEVIPVMFVKISVG